MSYLNLDDIIQVNVENQDLKNLKSHHLKLFNDQLQKSATTVLKPCVRQKYFLETQADQSPKKQTRNSLLKSKDSPLKANRILNSKVNAMESPRKRNTKLKTQIPNTINIQEIKNEENKDQNLQNSLSARTKSLTYLNSPLKRQRSTQYLRSQQSLKMQTEESENLRNKAQNLYSENNLSFKQYISEENYKINEDLTEQSKDDISMSFQQNLDTNNDNNNSNIINLQCQEQQINTKNTLNSDNENINSDNKFRLIETEEYGVQKFQNEIPHLKNTFLLSAYGVDMFGKSRQLLPPYLQNGKNNIDFLQFIEMKKQEEIQNQQLYARQQSRSPIKIGTRSSQQSPLKNTISPKKQSRNSSKSPLKYNFNSTGNKLGQTSYQAFQQNIIQGTQGSNQKSPLRNTIYTNDNSVQITQFGQNQNKLIIPNKLQFKQQLQKQQKIMKNNFRNHRKTRSDGQMIFPQIQKNLQKEQEQQESKNQIYFSTLNNENNDQSSSQNQFQFQNYSNKGFSNNPSFLQQQNVTEKQDINIEWKKLYRY